LLQYYDKKQDVKRPEQIFARYRHGLPIFASLSFNMIQRIQSLWLLLASLCSGLVFLPPLANGMENLQLYMNGWTLNDTVIESTGALWVLALGCALLPLPVIFQFRKRSRQVRMIRVIMLLNLILVLLLSVEIYQAENAKPSPGLILIPAAIIFLFLAAGAISKDDKLVRSADRLR
jgi:succinate-acetate transporter protein